MKKKLLYLPALCMLLLSCTENATLSGVDLPANTAMNDANRYALIIETYVSLRDKPGDNGITIAHARRLDILPITGIEIVQKDEEQILWIDVGEGWLPRSSVQLYTSKEKALTAAKKLK